jgi:hypothetical protein
MRRANAGLLVLLVCGVERAQSLSISLCAKRPARNTPSAQAITQSKESARPKTKGFGQRRVDAFEGGKSSNTIQDTERQIQQRISEYNRTQPHLHEAITLELKLEPWRRKYAHLTALQQAMTLPPAYLREMAAAEDALRRIGETHGITHRSVSVALHQATW